VHPILPKQNVKLSGLRIDSVVLAGFLDQNQLTFCGFRIEREWKLIDSLSRSSLKFFVDGRQRYKSVNVDALKRVERNPIFIIEYFVVWEF
jgi:hypothetical protein